MGEGALNARFPDLGIEVDTRAEEQQLGLLAAGSQASRRVVGSMVPGLDHGSADAATGAYLSDGRKLS